MLPATPPTSSVADLKRCLPCCVPKAPWSKPPSCGLRPTVCQERYQSWSGLCVCHGDAPLVGRSHLESGLEQGLNCAEKMPWVSGHNLWAPLPPYHLPADPPSTGGLRGCSNTPSACLPHHACWQGVSRLTEQHPSEPTLGLQRAGPRSAP